MNDNIIVRTEKDYKVSKWSGGDTTELYLYPENGDYKAGNFSTAYQQRHSGSGPVRIYEPAWSRAISDDLSGTSGYDPRRE